MYSHQNFLAFILCYKLHVRCNLTARFFIHQTIRVLLTEACYCLWLYGNSGDIDIKIFLYSFFFTTCFRCNLTGNLTASFFARMLSQKMSLSFALEIIYERGLMEHFNPKKKCQRLNRKNQPKVVGNKLFFVFLSECLLEGWFFSRYLCQRNQLTS